MRIYVVTMYRWGNPENHSYVIGAYSTLALAVEAGKEEEQYRGNKYEATIAERALDTSYDREGAIEKAAYHLRVALESKEQE